MDGTIPSMGCMSAAPSPVPEGYINIRTGMCTISFELLPNAAIIEEQLDVAYARAKAVLKGIHSAEE